MKPYYIVEINFSKKVSKDKWEALRSFRRQVDAMEYVRNSHTKSPIRITRVVRTIVLQMS